MLQFPISNFFDEQKCYKFLMELLHPEGLHCRCGHALSSDQAPHKKQRRPCIVNYKCSFCRSVFNIFTHTIWFRSSYKCSTIVRIL